ncbi:MAG: hypothetical protein AAF547_06010 [Actinomycetota bacterium]
MSMRRRSVRLLLAMATAGLLAAGCGSGGLGADAGDDFEIQLGEAPMFDGCDSTGDGLSYTWTIVEAPADMADDVGKVLRQSIGDCSFTLESTMEVADLGTWVIELSVTDGDGTETDRVTVVVA